MSLTPSDPLRSTSVSSPGETMPRSDSADSQSQAIQEEPLPSTSNEEDDPLAGEYLTGSVCCMYESYSTTTASILSPTHF